MIFDRYNLLTKQQESVNVSKTNDDKNAVGSRGKLAYISNEQGNMSCHIIITIQCSIVRRTFEAVICQLDLSGLRRSRHDRGTKDVTGVT